MSGGPGGGGTTPMFQEWLQELSKKGTLTSSSGGQKITDKLKGELEEALKELGSSIADRWESYEVSLHCAEAWKLVEAGGQQKNDYLQELCKGIAEIKYFMSGVKTVRTGQAATSDKGAEITKLTDDNTYPRCIVGALVLSELYADHCHFDKVIGHLGDKVDEKIKTGHTTAADNLDICKEVTKEDLVFAKSLLQNKIKQWTEGERKEGHDFRRWRIYKPWTYWQHVCGSGRGDKAKLQQHRKKNAPSMTTFLKLNDNNTSSRNEVSIEDVLADGENKYTVQQDKLEEKLSKAIKNGSSVDPDAMKELTQMLTDKSHTVK
ncbi:SICAvar, type I (fragment), partial [Plasmodium knowlesi strain H]